MDATRHNASAGQALTQPQRGCVEEGNSVLSRFVSPFQILLSSLEKPLQMATKNVRIVILQLLAQLLSAFVLGGEPNHGKGEKDRRKKRPLSDKAALIA